MKETNNTKPYTFKVWIDGNYYLDDEEFEKEIPLSEKEVATIKKLIDDYEDDLSQGLMPILKTGPKKLYKKFYDAIFPTVFLYLFDEEYVEEMKEKDRGRHWELEDVDYLIKTYGDNFDFDEAYICNYPEGWEPVKPSLSKQMTKEEIFKYTKRWCSSRESLFDDITARHMESNYGAEPLYEYIDKKLVEIVQDHIEQTDEATLNSEDFNLDYAIIDLDQWKVADDIFEEYQKDEK